MAAVCIVVPLINKTIEKKECHDIIQLAYDDNL